MTSHQRVAVVTGGNRGIGLEVCRQLGERGVHVVLTSRSLDSGRAACAGLSEHGVSAEVFEMDVRDRQRIEALANHLQEQHGGVDILVNNAGVAMSGFDPDVVRTTLDTNLFAPLAIYDRLLPLMRDGARVVMVSSGMGERSYLSEDLARRFDDDPDRERLLAMMSEFHDDVVANQHEGKGWPSSAYRVSKLGLNKLTEILAQELEQAENPRNILVNAACPGWVRTDMGGPHASRSAEEGADTPVWLALLEGNGPQGGFLRDRAPVTW